MEMNSHVRRAVRRALVLSAVTATGAALPVHAQAQEAAESVDTVVVTGSRIRSANLEGTSPVMQVSAVDIAKQGVTRIEDLVTQLPQAFATQNSTVANGADGTATVNLRGLGSARTLVLIDGRRMPYGGGNSSAADLNQIPTSMVERVDVLTGGSSAVYGSDAVAGVVNFIMKKDFEGVQFDAQWGTFQHNNSYGGPGATKLRTEIANKAAINPAQFALPKSNVTDGESREFSVTIGASTADGRGNITAYASVRDNKSILERDRDYSACALGPTGNTSASFVCSGSGTSATGQINSFGLGGVLNDGPDGVPNSGDEPAEPYTDYAFTVDGNTFRPYSSATDAYNFGPLNYYQRPDTRYTLGAMGHYELNEHADVYTQLMFSDYKSVAQIAPGGAFGETGTINCDNPLLPQGQLADIGCTPTRVANGDSVPMYILRRNVEGGNRLDSFANDSFRSVLGVRGAISQNWSYDVYAQYSKVKTGAYTLNRFILPRFQNAINVVTDPDSGNPVCQSVLDGSDPNCVPYNVFDLNGITPEALAYLQTPSLQIGRYEQSVYSGSVSGDLGGIGFKSPLARDAVQVVFGVESRTDEVDSVPDANLQSGQLMGQGGATTALAGKLDVLDLFTEVRIPLLTDMPGAQNLSIDGAYRYSDYDDLSTDTYKIGLEWAPIRDVRFRASFQRAVRAANVIELFSAQSFNLFDIAGDPCGAQARSPDATDAECIATGVPASTYTTGNPANLDSPAGQYQLLQGGNPGLLPEKSDTKSFGVILQPRFLPKLAMSIDYFNIDVQDTVSTFGPSNTLTACYTNNDADACSRVVRNPGTGQLWLGDGHVIDTNINIGSLETTGVDVNIAYSGIELGRFGDLSVTMLGTWLDKLVTNPGPGIDPYNCVGLFADDCGLPTPEIRTHTRIDWRTPWNVDASLTWRYMSSVDEFRSNPAQIDYSLASQSYFDLSANWQVTEKGSLMLGVNNVLDEDPPLNSNVGTTGNGNTYPQIYDAFGRFIFVRAKLAF